MSIATEITRLQGAKADIKASIEGKGVTVPSNATLDTYDSYIDQITGGGGDDSNLSLDVFTVSGTLPSQTPGSSVDTTGLSYAADYSYSNIPAAKVTISPSSWPAGQSGIKTVSISYTYNNTTKTEQKAVYVGNQTTGTLHFTDLDPTTSSAWSSSAAMYCLGYKIANTDTVIDFPMDAPIDTWENLGLEPEITRTITGSPEYFCTNYSATPAGYSNIKEVLINYSYSSTYLSRGLFQNWSNLERVVVRGNAWVNQNSSRLFYGCTNLTYADLGSNSNSNRIPEYCFYNCSNLTTVIVPSTATRISENAFEGCTSLASITLPSSLTLISNYAFKDCSSLASLTIPEGVTSFGNYAFQNCGIASISLPSTLTTLGTWCFHNVNELTSLTIPDAVTSANSFLQGASKLASITIGSGVTSMTSTIRSCSVLAEVHMKPTTPPTIDSGTFEYTPIKSGTGTIYVPYSADHSVLAAYQSANVWSTYASLMQEEPQN